MYSGTTFRNKSGHIVGVHQKIDRVARRIVGDNLKHGEHFPSIQKILHFEGKNGPDGIKRKSPAVDEPWHYIDPTNPSDTALPMMIDDHISNLATALRDGNDERAAFEAAWLSHAIVDGLTPAHHYPLSDKIEELWGRPKEDRLTIRDKNIIKGKNRRDTMAKNWEYWGVRGIFSTHLLFELGVAAAIKTHRFLKVETSAEDLENCLAKGYGEYFMKAVNTVNDLEMYEDFWKNGWSNRLARKTRQILMPEVIRAVALAWQVAIAQSKAAK